MLVLFCISLIIGSTFYYQLNFSLTEIYFLSILWGVFFCLIFRNFKGILIGLILTLTVILGALRIWMMPVHEIEIGNRALSGIVQSIDERLDKTLLIVKLDNSDGKVQVELSHINNILPGDYISFRGQVKEPENFVTDSGRIFPYKQYLSSKGIDAIVNNAQIANIEFFRQGLKNGEIRNYVVRYATITRSWIARQLSKNISFPVDGIVSGMLVGFQGGIPKYLSDIFRVTGTLHTLVLSGYNITVLATFIGILLRRAQFKVRNILIFFGIFSLVLVSGAGIAAVRAGIMGSIALLATATLRTYNVFRALLFAFLFFFMTMPKAIFSDPGFHLSFLATLFIITILPILKEKLIWIPNWKVNFRELSILSFGLPIFMLPYLMYFSGLFPIVSPIANMFLVPIIPLLMLGGLAVVVFSPITLLTNFFGTLTSFVGGFTINVLTFFGKLPQWQTPNLSGFGVLGIYSVLFVLIYKREIITYFAHLRNTFRIQTNSNF